MHHKRSFLKMLLPAVLLTPTIVRCEEFLTLQKAQAILGKGQKMTERSITLTKDQQKAIQKASGVRVRSAEIKAWKMGNGGWLFVDNVLGKHEFIDFAVALTADGAVSGVEVLVYRETYGGEVRHPKWLAQFFGKKAGAALEVDEDVKNISGATLSSVHMAEGVRRLLHTYDLVVKSLPAEK